MYVRIIMSEEWKMQESRFKRIFLDLGYSSYINGTEYGKMFFLIKIKLIFTTSK